MTPTLYYTKRQWLFHRFTTSSDKQPTLWHIFTHGFCTTFDRLIPLSADIFNNYQHLAPTYSINLSSPTSSCDSAPSRPRARPPPPPPSNHSDDTPSPSPPPQLLPARKRKQPPPPPLNPQADWDTWDGDADCRLVELKSNPKLRPNWIFIARRVGYSVEQCQARWKELKDLQKLQDNKPPQSASPPADLEKLAPPPPPRLSSPNHISPTPTSPANTPPPPSQADFSPSPTTTPRSTHDMSPHEASPLQLAAERAPSEDRHPEPHEDPPIGSYFI